MLNVDVKILTNASFIEDKLAQVIRNVLIRLDHIDANVVMALKSKMEPMKSSVLMWMNALKRLAYALNVVLITGDRIGAHVILAIA